MKHAIRGFSKVRLAETLLWSQTDTDGQTHTHRAASYPNLETYGSWWAAQESQEADRVASSSGPMM